MNRRLPAPKIIIIHAGHIVMHERVGMERFDNRGHGHRAGGFNAVQSRDSITRNARKRLPPCAAYPMASRKSPAGNRDTD